MSRFKNVVEVDHAGSLSSFVTHVHIDKGDLSNALLSFSTAVMNTTKAAGYSESCKSVEKKERSAAKALLKLLYGRSPTPEEIQDIIPG